MSIPVGALSLISVYAGIFTIMCCAEGLKFTLAVWCGAALLMSTVWIAVGLLDGA